MADQVTGRSRLEIRRDGAFYMHTDLGRYRFYRLYREAGQKDFQAVIHSPQSFSHFFKDMTNRIANATKRGIANDSDSFDEYLARGGLKLHYDSHNLTIHLNPEQTKMLPAGVRAKAGFMLSYYLQKNKALHPNHIPDRFLEAYTRFDNNRDSLSLKKLGKMEEKIDYYYDLITDLFPFTAFQKGLSVQMRSPHLLKLERAVYYAALGVHAELDEDAEEPESVVMVPTGVVDPWEVEVPEIENVLQGGKER